MKNLPDLDVIDPYNYSLLSAYTVLNEGKLTQLSVFVSL